MPAILANIPTPTIVEEATKVLTARATASTSSPTDYSSPGAIAGFVWFGIIGTIVLASFIGVCYPVLYIIAAPFIIIHAGLKKIYNLTIGPSIKRRRQRKKEARTARSNHAMELRARGRHRHQWALEELQLARKDGRIPNLPRTWVEDLERGWRQKKNFQFGELPAELRLQIYSEFDIGTALKLMRVNRFFYWDRPVNGINREERATFVWHAETFKRNKHRLACFGCLRLRDRAEFEDEYRSGEFERFGKNEFDRRCFDCQVEKGEIKWPLWRWTVRSCQKAGKASLRVFKRRR